MIADQAARDRIRGDLDTTLIVEAAAGTGKTTELVQRILALVASGRARLAEVAAVTFTEKAAGELKLRLRTEIEAQRSAAPPEVRERLDAALRELEVAMVSTIHGLCADLLREHPVEAAVDPEFEVLAEPEAQRLLDRAFDAWFQDVLADPPEGVRRVLRRDTHRGPRATLRRAAWSLAEHRDFPTPWRRDPWDRDAALDDVVEQLRALGPYVDRARDPSDYLALQLAAVRRFVDDLDRVERHRPRDHDGLEAGLRGVRSPPRGAPSWRHRGYGVAYGDGLARADVLAARDAVKAALDAVVARCDADLAPLLQHELQPVLTAYHQLKVRSGRLDFLDLLLETRQLLVRDAGARARLQARIRYLLVDEFQDTDPLQADIALLLAAADPAVSDPAEVVVRPGALFIVGDPKQSIYRFRRADIGFYQSVKERLQAQGAAVLHLSTSFRSDPRIQAAVNAAFAPILTGGAQAGYVPLDPHRAEEAGRPAVVALPVPDPYGGWRSVTMKKVEPSLAGAVAAWVHWVVNESGWTVQDPRTREHGPILARHVCLLFRRLHAWGTAVTAPYVQQLEARDIPHVLLGGKALHEREEVVAIRTALSAIEWPDDALSVYATLRGPLFALPDDALLVWTERFSSLDPLRPTDDVPEDLEPVHDALAVLRRLHHDRNRYPIADTLGALLAATRAHAGFASWHGGAQALANVLRVAQVARAFEGRTGTSFRSFVEHLHDEADRGDATEAPVVEEDVDGVRIMSVHKAKGLEFPVVVLCDPMWRPGGYDPSHHVDPAAGRWLEPLAGSVPSELREREDEVREREREEEHRVLYVAATRARDVLVVPVIGDAAPDGWHAPLVPVVYPSPGARHRRVPAPGCPAFGPESMLAGPEGRPVQTGDTVAPGLHVAATGGHEVVWWDPALLRRHVDQAPGVRRQRLFSAEGEHAAGVDRYAAWFAARLARLAKGIRESRDVRTPTRIAHAQEGEPVQAPPLVVERTGVERFGRPHGTRFGTLVHEVLAVVPLDAAAPAVAELTAWQARRLGATAEEVQAAAEAVLAALAHPLMRRAARSPDLRREVSVALAMPDHHVEGIADLVFAEDGGWWVVDYKTDVELGELEAAYRVQVDCYVRAVARATGAPVRGALLLV